MEDICPVLPDLKNTPLGKPYVSTYLKEYSIPK